MIEVIQIGNRWTWQMLDAAARVIVYVSETWTTDFEAFEASWAYRSAFWCIASEIDHRMGACF